MLPLKIFRLRLLCDRPLIFDINDQILTNHYGFTDGKQNMNIAKEYFKKQWKNEEFKHSYLEEKVKLDIEYHLKELKRDIESQKPQEVSCYS